MEQFTEETVQSLELTQSQLKHLSQVFDSELEKGLQRDGEMLKALPTHVYNLPKGSEQGTFLTVDFGGTNLRVGRVELLGNGQYTFSRAVHTIPTEFKSGSGFELFEFIAEKVQDLVQSEQVSLPCKLGFTFSFPIEQASLNHGKILGWSKEIDGRGVIGLDAVALLESALARRELEAIQVASLVNDTVGTLLAMLYTDSRTKMSVILGTGSNAAYIERQMRIRKIPSAEKKRHELTLINIEWGSFGDTEQVDNCFLPQTEVDRELDQQSMNPGKQRYEKMISGMYLGEIFRRILVQAQKRALLTASPTEPYKLPTSFMSDFYTFWRDGDKDKCLQLMASHDIRAADPGAILSCIAKLCEAISLRSVRLCASGIASVFKRLESDELIAKDELCIVAVDGSLYQRYPDYKELLQAEVCAITAPEEGLEWCRIVMVMAEDLSSIGAAAAIAAAK
jgi:hexokinase